MLQFPYSNCIWCVCVCVCPGSWAAYGRVWSSSTRQLTAAWERTTWFTSTSRRRLALLSSSPLSPHTSSCLPTSTSPHVSPTPCLSVCVSVCLWPVCLLSFFLSFFFPYLFKVPKIQTHAYCTFVLYVQVCLCAKAVPVWCRDNPHTGTLYTAARMHPAKHLSNLPVETFVQLTNAHTY